MNIVRDCMSTDVTVCAPGDSISHAARTMRDIDAGFLPIGEHDRLIGMVTDRDLAVRALAEGRGPDTPVRDVMSAEVLYCYDDDDLDTAAQQMGDQQVRRMPVLNRDKRLVGILSLGDISHAQNNGSGRIAQTLAAVTQPSAQHNQI
jgi:CBS domain-containing protein